MEFILGIIAIFFAIKNIIAWTHGKDPQKYRFLSLAFTSLTIFFLLYGSGVSIKRRYSGRFRCCSYNIRNFILLHNCFNNNKWNYAF